LRVIKATWRRFRDRQRAPNVDSHRADRSGRRSGGTLNVEPTDPGEFTQLLIASRAGDSASWSSLMRLVYGDLRRLARRHVTSIADANTLGTTGLVNECYLRLAGPARASVENRRHFLNLASRVMRQVLCDYARERLSEKRGGSQRREDL